MRSMPCRIDELQWRWACIRGLSFAFVWQVTTITPSLLGVWVYVHYEKKKEEEKNHGGCDHGVLVPILPSMVLVWTVWAFMASGNFGGSGSSWVTTYDGTHLMQSHNLLDLMGDSLFWCNPTFFNPWWETGLMQYHIPLDWAQTSYPQLYDERLSWCKLTFL